MHKIEQNEVTKEFVELWKAAATHLDHQVQGGIHFWLKANLDTPFLEHISFRLGNQLFFIRVEDIEGVVEWPASIKGLHTIANGCAGHACLMPMKKDDLGNWQTTTPGWGLIDSSSGKPVFPFDLVTEEKLVMTDWELQDFSVQIVRQSLEKEGFELIGWQSNPNVYPSIWFQGKSGKPEWVMVGFSRKSKTPAQLPDNIQSIIEQYSKISPFGYFAPVYPASSDDPFDPLIGTRAPMYRGHKLVVMYKGLEKITA